MTLVKNKSGTRVRAIGAAMSTAIAAGMLAFAPVAHAATFQPASDLFDPGDQTGKFLVYGRNVTNHAISWHLDPHQRDDFMHFCVNAGVGWPDNPVQPNGEFNLSEYRSEADSVPSARPYRLNDAAFAYLASRTNDMGWQAATHDRTSIMLQALVHLNFERDTIRMNWDTDGSHTYSAAQRIEMMVREMEAQYPDNAKELRDLVSTLNNVFPDNANVDKGTVTTGDDLTATLSGYGAKTADGKGMAYVHDGNDPDITVTLNGPSSFDDGSQSKTVKASQAGALKIKYTGFGTVNYTVKEQTKVAKLVNFDPPGDYPNRDQREIRFNISTQDATADGSFEPNIQPKPKPAVKLRTTAADKSDGDKVLLANQKEATITDTVTLSNSRKLQKDEKVTLRGQVVRTADGTPVGAPVCKAITTPVDAGKFEEKIDLTIPTMGLHEKQVTVFERLYSGDDIDCANPDESKIISVHENRDDKDQTLDVKHSGEIKTTAYNQSDNSKQIAADKDQTILDRIDISKSNLQPGKVYKVNAQPVVPWYDGAPVDAPVAFDKLGKVDKLTPVIDKNNQKAVALPYKSVKVAHDSAVAKDAILDGGKVGDVMLADDEFVYTEGMDHVDVVISGVDMTGRRARQKVVMFEKVSADDIVPLVHADVNDETQTVTVQSTLKTNLYRVVGNEESKEYTPGEKTALVDKVQARGVEANKTYLVKLELMTPTEDKNLDKQDGVEDGMTPYTDKDGKPVVAEQEINVNKNNVDYNVTADFTASDKRVEITAYETLTDKSNPENVLTHKDPKDKDQTVTPDTPTTPATPPAPHSAAAPKLAKTGANSLGVLSIAGVLSALGAVAGIARKKIIK